MYLIAEGGYVGACGEDADATESCQGVPRYDEQLGRQCQAAEPAHLDEDDQVDDADNAGERQEAEEAGDEEEVAAASAGGRGGSWSSLSSVEPRITMAMETVDAWTVLEATAAKHER